jgi:hypothetical protein
VHWPDGRYVRVSPLDPTSTVDRAVLARVARSVGPVDRGELDAAYDDGSASDGELRPYASAERPS